MTDVIENVQDYIGQSLFDDAGQRIGKIGAVYLDDVTGQPQWVTVDTGFFGANQSFVPAADAAAQEDGLAVPFSQDTVKDAPNVDVESGHLSTEEEENLYRYYGLDYVDAVPESPVASDAVAAPDGIPPADVLPEAPDVVPDEDSNIGRTDLVQRDADYDDSDATGMSAGPTNRRGTELGEGKARLRRWTQPDR